MSWWNSTERSLRRIADALEALEHNVGSIADTLAAQSDPAALRALADMLDAKAAEWAAKVADNTPLNTGHGAP